MADKVQLIKEEIERRIKEISDACDGVIMVETISVEYNTLCNIRDYINSLPEENHFEDKSEMVSEGLEEAADNYAQQHSELLGFDCDCEPIQTGPELKKAVKFGAEWQKQRDQETIELAEDHAMLAGMNKMKEEMMKNAVEGRVQCGYGDGNKLSIKAMLPQDSDLKYADKVKVLILKTE